DRMTFGYVQAYFFSSGRRHTSTIVDWSTEVCSSGLEPAGRASATSIADYAFIACQRLLPYVIELSVAVGKCPCLFLIQPHQRCFNDEILIHGEVCRNVHGFDENIPAIRVTAEVRLAHACNDCFCICLISQCGSE